MQATGLDETFRHVVANAPGTPAASGTDSRLRLDRLAAELEPVGMGQVGRPR